MQKVVYSVSRLNRFGNTKMTGVGFITDSDLIIACVSKKGNAYILAFVKTRPKLRRAVCSAFVRRRLAVVLVQIPFVRPLFIGIEIEHELVPLP